MATAIDFRRICLSLDGTIEVPHFERTAFKVRRIYASLAADGLHANICLTPDEQEFKVMLAPEAFQPIDNAWGRRGWTTVALGSVSEKELHAALAMAHAHGRAK